MDESLIKAATKILGLDPTITFNSMEIILAYEGSPRKEEHKEARFLLLENFVERQLIRGNKEFYHIDTPYSNPCPDCRSIGRKIILEYNSISTPCTKCEGSGIKTEICWKCKDRNGKDVNGKPCKTCGGKGKYQFKASTKRKLPIPCPDCSKYKQCPKCEGKRTVLGVKCDQCFGHSKVPEGPLGLGHIKVMVPTGKIKDSYKCPSCYGTGREFKKEEKKNLNAVASPVIDPVIGEKLITTLEEMETKNTTSDEVPIAKV